MKPDIIKSIKYHPAEFIMALILLTLVFILSRQAAAIVITASSPSASADRQSSPGGTASPFAGQSAPSGSGSSPSADQSASPGSGSAPFAGQSRPVVVLDSGHGGFDPGKIGVDGSLEKDLNLQIARRVKQYLESSDVDVIMTRESDIGLYSESDTNKKTADMRARCQLINDASPDLVVSIHQNSYHEESVKGAQVFYYKSSEQGKRLAEILQRRFDYVLGSANTRSAKANDSYYLLLHVKSPIVIAECGFLSNWSEAAMLNQEDYQDRIAWTIHMGIMEYLNTR